MIIKYFEANHPKNGFDIIIGYNEDLKIESVTYTDDEDVYLTEFVKSHIIGEIKIYTNT
jgi:hypothetical protein